MQGRAAILIDSVYMSTLSNEGFHNFITACWSSNVQGSPTSLQRQEEIHIIQTMSFREKNMTMHNPDRLDYSHCTYSYQCKTKHYRFSLETRLMSSYMPAFSTWQKLTVKWQKSLLLCSYAWYLCRTLCSCRIYTSAFLRTNRTSRKRY